ncbi:MAG: phenylalanine--tRNA ligase subunit beta, partial [Clostridia bacterium]|nr:phenylalanine--tRNA ligase subunit beta [Clostridia bacterium]
MNISLKWLNDLIDIKDISVQEYCDGMTYSGTKVEGYEVLDEEIQNVVVGKIEKIEKHPDADKLLVCMLNVGKESDIQIVTGAHNISVGDLVPVCLDGAKLPGGKTIKSGKLRGVVSDGMLCSIAELGLTKHDVPDAAEDGIFILDSGLIPGTDIKKALMMDDTVVEFELTFNRPDCLGLVGIARETAATFGRKYDYKLPEVKRSSGDDKVSDYLSVEIKNSELCPRYSAAVVKNVKIEPSPLWLRMRLRAIGIRPINNIV